MRIIESIAIEIDEDMRVNEMQTEKLNLIAWISQLQDISLIKKLKAFQAENLEIPETYKQEVRKRLKNTDPADYRSMEEIQVKLNNRPRKRYGYLSPQEMFNQKVAFVT